MCSVGGNLDTSDIAGDECRCVCVRRQSRAPNLVAAARRIVASSGVAGLYRGNLVNVLRSAPQKSLDFFAFDMFKVGAAFDCTILLELAGKSLSMA